MRVQTFDSCCPQINRLMWVFHVMVFIRRTCLREFTQSTEGALINKCDVFTEVLDKRVTSSRSEKYILKPRLRSLSRADRLVMILKILIHISITSHHVREGLFV